MSLDLDARYAVRGWNGVAFVVRGFPKRWEPYRVLEADEDGDEHEVETDDGEWTAQDETCGRVNVVMVGDDRGYEVDIEDLTPLT